VKRGLGEWLSIINNKRKNKNIDNLIYTSVLIFSLLSLNCIRSSKNNLSIIEEISCHNSYNKSKELCLKKQFEYVLVKVRLQKETDWRMNLFMFSLGGTEINIATKKSFIFQWSVCKQLEKAQGGSLWIN